MLEYLFASAIAVLCIVIVLIFKKFNTQKSELNYTKNLLIEKNEHLIELYRKLQSFKDLSIMDMDLASNVQKSLLQQKLPDLKEWNIAFEYNPHLPVSGDFYDFYIEDNKLIGLCLFDVTGHGVSAGLVAVLTKPIVFRKFMHMRDKPLPEIALAVHNSIVEKIGDIGIFLTGILIRMNDQTVEYINMGHPEMLLQHNDSINKLVPNEKFGYKSPPLGIYDYKAPKESAVLHLERNDAICLYSDCLTESSENLKNNFEESRVIELLEKSQEKSSQETIHEIVDAFYKENTKDTIKDDLTVIVVKKL